MINISFISMTQGNPVALKRTLDSLKDICNEFIIGSVCIFEEDKKIIDSYKNDFNLKIVELPFNHIYKNGFANTLNLIASHATNDLCLYLNVGEIVDGEERILRLINEKFSMYNAYAINHGIERHTWCRLWDKTKLKWDGLIHEEIIGDKEERNLCPYYVFQFKDTDKDLDNSFKAKCYDDTKEICYFGQYVKLVENPELKGITNDWWINFAKDNYDSMKTRLFAKRERYEAFEEGNLEKYLNDIYTNPLFEKERFDSNTLIEFQNSFKSL